MAGEDHINQSAALRGKGNFVDAIAEIENNRSKFDDTSLEVALLQAFYAAREANDKESTTKYAQEIFAINPNIPSVANFL